MVLLFLKDKTKQTNKQKKNCGSEDSRIMPAKNCMVSRVQPRFETSSIQFHSLPNLRGFLFSFFLSLFFTYHRIVVDIQNIMITLQVSEHTEKYEQSFLRKIIDIEGFRMLVYWGLYQLGELCACFSCQQLPSKNEFLMWQSKQAKL